MLVAPLQSELENLETQLDGKSPQLQNAIDAVEIAPHILGADGLRRYLLLFTTPSEARGLAGFIGNYVEITIDDGDFAVTDFGRRSDLDAYVRDNGATCTACSQEQLDRYGPAGLASQPDGSAGPEVWTGITFPANFPDVGVAAQNLYPQSGGRPIDGVLSLDPYVVQALLNYVGPIEVPDLGVTVEPGNAADFILRRQYVLAGDTGTRIDGLETLGQAAIQGLLAGALPVPSELAADMGQLVEEHRLLFWTDDPAEQKFLDRIGMSARCCPSSMTQVSPSSRRTPVTTTSTSTSNGRPPLKW